MAKSSSVTWVAVAIALLGLSPAPAFAHGDRLDGPVAKAAQPVEFIHLVERLYDSTMQAAHGHVDETESSSKNR